jgi:hypothetical protein
MPEETAEGAQVAALLKEATPEAAAKLQEIANTTTSKETRKAARRALYRLGLSGIAPPEHAQRAAAEETRTQAADTLRAFATAFDGAGNRLLLFALADPDGGSPTLMQALFNDEAGIETFDAVKQPRRELAERIERLEQRLEQDVAFAEIEGDYGRWLLQRARDINHRLSRPTPPGFLEGAHRIGAPQGDYTTPPVLAAIPPETVRGDLSIPHDPAALFALPWFEPWYFATRDVMRWLEAWEQAEQSVIALTDSAKAERRERILTEAVDSLMTPEVRARYVTRLEESADVLRRRGKEEAARIALYQTLTLADNSPVAEAPFARALVQRTIEAALEVVHAERERAETTGRPVVRP